MSESDDRPDPDALLRAHARGERARLKLFLGAAPGVGKTYAMLAQARERRREGVDVVVGVVETHGRAETEGLLEGLERVPRRRVEYQGRVLEEMDLDAVLARRPALVLVDELAHTNAPGSRHDKRFADVEELLEAGIAVDTTMNVQHLESLNDVVAQVTGVRVRETVPDRMLERADEVKLIDLPPEELVKRLREGKVYLADQAERAITHFFKPANLAALRELALRATAAHVDERVREYLQGDASAGPWALGERLVVGIDGRAESARLVRAARRAAERSDAPWIAVFVEPPRFADLPEAERERVARVLRLAERLGAEVATIPGSDVAEELLRFARERKATSIVLGKAPRPWWRWFAGASIADRVLAGSEAIEVRILPTAPARGGGEESTVPLRTAETWRRYVLALAAAGVSGLAAFALERLFSLPDPGVIFLAGVMVAAVAGGLGPSIAASIAGVLLYNFFFVAPVYTFTITRPQDVVLLVVFLAVAISTSSLATRIAEQAASARRRAARTAALLDFAREIAAAADLATVGRVIVEHFAELTHGMVGLFLSRAGRLELYDARPLGAAIPDAERATASWVFEHDRPAGPGTDTLPGGEWLHLPVRGVRGPVASLTLRTPRAGAPFSPELEQHLEALSRQAATALERTRADLVEAVIEGIDDGLVVLDPAGVVVHVNEVACAILAVDREEALGSPFEALGTSHPHYLRLRAAVRERLGGQTPSERGIEISLFHRGRDHHYLLRTSPFRALDGSDAGLVLVLQDVTVLRDQEAQREQLMATLSHELRTPLTSLGMAIELLQRGGGDAAPLLAAAHEDVFRLDDLARRLLDLSRSRAMTIALERAPMDLVSVVTRASRLFELQARERKVVLEIAVPPEPLPIAGDPTKITWACSNLLANALRYTPAGGTVRIGACATEGGATITVSDTGPGIPAEQRERIFERFVQGDTDPGGAGLGLAIVRDIVQAHGGRIRLESEIGRGSRFTLELPKG